MRRILVSVLAISCVACDAGQSGPDVSGPHGEVLGAVCDLLDRCPDAFGQPIAYRSRLECQQILHFVLTCRLTEAGDNEWGVEENVPEVDPAAAEACIAWLEAASCDTVLEGPSPCADLLVVEDDDGGSSSGSSGDGQPCDGDYDCLEELRCIGGEVDEVAHVTTCQVCVPRVGEGEECWRASERECADGLYCTLQDRSLPGLCLPPLADGEPCIEAGECTAGWCNTDDAEATGFGVCDAGGNEGESCAESCRQGLFCDGGTCAALRANGEACADQFECANYNCDVAAGVCGLADGQPCSSASQCASRGCVGGVCGAPMPGGSCSTDEDCVAGELCNWDSFVCVAPQGDGSSCGRDEECTSGYCNFDDRCQTPPSLGDACTDTLECGPRAYCSGGVCVERSAPGAACEGYDSCMAPFLCQNGRCELINLLCRPAHAGEQCAFLRVCDEASYCDLLGGITCRPRGNEGESCSPSFIPGVQVCAIGLRCANDPTTGESTCQRRAALGEACEGGADACAEGSYCFAGSCMAAPVGQHCDGGTPCPDGYTCSDGVEEVCVPPGPAGTRCEDDSACIEGLFCDSYQCAERRAVGTDCRETNECVTSAYCDTNVYQCAARLAPGTLCASRDDPCREGFYCPRGVTDATCIPRLAAGEPCYEDVECESGACNAPYWCLASAMCVAP